LLDFPELESSQHIIRHNRLSLTKVKNPEDGTDDLLRYFGGEYLRRLIIMQNKSSLLPILESVGKPLRIEVNLSKNLLNEYQLKAEEFLYEKNISQKHFIKIEEI